MFAKKKQPLNFLNLIPVRKDIEFTDTEGKVTLLLPKFKNEKFSNWFIPRSKTTKINFRMDETGSQVWRLIDGYKSVEKICSDLHIFLTNINKPTSQIEERVTRFLTDLAKNNFIRFNEVQSQSGE